MLSSAEQALKGFIAISVTPLPIDTVVKFEHPENAQ
jgi:hypothetical protein